MLGDGIVSFGVMPSPTCVFQKPEMVGENRVAKPDPVVDAQCRRSEIKRAGFVEELHMQLLVGLRDAAELVDEVHVPCRPPEFSVGGGLQPDVALHGDDVADGCILGLTQCFYRDLARRALSARLQQRGGRRRLPTWSARNGGSVRLVIAGAHRPLDQRGSVPDAAFPLRASAGDAGAGGFPRLARRCPSHRLTMSR